MRMRAWKNVYAHHYGCIHAYRYTHAWRHMRVSVCMRKTELKCWDVCQQKTNNNQKGPIWIKKRSTPENVMSKIHSSIGVCDFKFMCLCCLECTHIPTPTPTPNYIYLPPPTHTHTSTHAHERARLPTQTHRPNLHSNPPSSSMSLPPHLPPESYISNHNLVMPNSKCLPSYILQPKL